MTDDERRAEIEADREHEAVALAIQAAMPNTPGQLANVAIETLDRVRDARGDDEAGRWIEPHDALKYELGDPMDDERAIRPPQSEE